MCIRFSPDNMYVMSMGGDDRSAMQWRVLPVAHDDITVDKPDFAAYQVYQPPKKTAIMMEGGAQVIESLEYPCTESSDLAVKLDPSYLNC
jgi:hypothetical protein